LINDFKTRNKNESYYDLYEDYGLIEASFAQQYGIRLRNEDDMTWDEFTTLLSGLNGDTPLGNVVSIRSEKDPKRIKEFTKEQKRIHRDWQRKQAENMTREEYDEAMKMFSNLFRGMAETQKKK
jgi:hypothetical protein